MIECNSKLTTLHHQALVNLAQTCFDHDGGTPVIFYDLVMGQRATDSNVLYYHQGQLQGFLSVYFFYQTGCELSLLVSPSYRRKGVAQTLLARLLPLLQFKAMEKLIFSMASTADNQWLSQHDLTQQESDFHMQYLNCQPVQNNNRKLILRQGLLTDIEQLIEIDRACFTSIDVDMIQRFTHVLTDPNYTILLALLNDKIVGKAHLHWLDDKACLSDLAILPAYQHQGFGSELLGQCINYTLFMNKKTLTLDVEAQNQQALSIYHRFGFKTVRAQDYWAIDCQVLAAKLVSRR